MMLVEISERAINSATAVIHKRMNELANADSNAWLTAEYAELEMAVIALNSGV